MLLQIGWTAVDGDETIEMIQDKRRAPPKVYASKEKALIARRLETGVTDSTYRRIIGKEITPLPVFVEIPETEGE